MEGKQLKKIIKFPVTNARDSFIPTPDERAIFKWSDRNGVESGLGNRYFWWKLINDDKA